MRASQLLGQKAGNDPRVNFRLNPRVAQTNQAVTRATSFGSDLACVIACCRRASSSGQVGHRSASAGRVDRRCQFIGEMLEYAPDMGNLAPYTG